MSAICTLFRNMFPVVGGIEATWLEYDCATDRGKEIAEAAAVIPDSAINTPRRISNLAESLR